ncbi:MAG: hypothetical protein H7X76_08870 [Prolixibacteraceae bacterium]|nr:hypothetical protein [Burkholderiales bacterium]
MSNAGFDRETEPQALGLLQLREDPQYARISPDRRVALVEAALADGRTLADRTGERWGKDPEEVAARCNVPVFLSEGDAGFGSVVVYAEYAPQSRSITLYRPAIRRLDRLIEEHGVPVCRNSGSTMPIFLAHELYHHFDCSRGSARLSRRHVVRIFSVGPWHWTSGLPSLAEIAAGAFAQRLLGLSFHPKLLDSLLLESQKTF